MAEPTHERAGGREVGVAEGTVQRLPRKRLGAILILCAVVIAVAIPGVYWGWHLEVHTNVLIDYQNSTGSWSINRTTFSLEVSVCPSYSGWAYGTYSCEFTISNPMDIPQYLQTEGVAYGWTVPGDNPTMSSWGSNTTVEPNGTIQLMPAVGVWHVDITARLPGQGGDYTNTFAVSMSGWGCYQIPCG